MSPVFPSQIMTRLDKEEEKTRLATCTLRLICPRVRSKHRGLLNPPSLPRCSNILTSSLTFHPDWWLKWLPVAGRALKPLSRRDAMACVAIFTSLNHGAPDPGDGDRTRFDRHINTVSRWSVMSSPTAKTLLGFKSTLLCET